MARQRRSERRQQALPQAQEAVDEQQLEAVLKAAGAEAADQETRKAFRAVAEQEIADLAARAAQAAEERQQSQANAECVACAAAAAARPE